MTPPATVDNTTLFSTRDFVESWSRAFDHQYAPLAVSVTGSGPDRTMFFIQTPARYWSRHVSLARYDFCSSPGWTGELKRSTLAGILRQLRSPRTRSFAWCVRFDHEPIASGLSSFGLPYERFCTQVLPLSIDYDRVFARFNATMRNQIRGGRRKGVVIRETNLADDIRIFHRLYNRHAESKGWQLLYPERLSHELLRFPAMARFLVAEHDNTIIAGGLFVRDGTSVVYYLHGVSDRGYSDLFPSCVLIDEAIRWACQSGASFFNLGMSGSVASLQLYKSFWGAEVVRNWVFSWSNPLWIRMSSAKERLTGLIRGQYH